MVDLQLIGPSAICLFVSFDYHFLFFSCYMWHRKCLVYTHTIRSINHAMATTKKKIKKKKSDHSFFILLPKGHSIQSKKFKFLFLQSTNPFSSLSFFFSFFLVRCTCCMHTYTNKEKLSCHRLRLEKESNFLTEEASDGGKSEFHLHSKLAPATILSLYWYSNKHTTILSSPIFFSFQALPPYIPQPISVYPNWNLIIFVLIQLIENNGE